MIQEQFISRLLDGTRDNKERMSLITRNEITSEFFSEYESEFNYIKNHIEKYNSLPDVASFLGVFPNFPLLKPEEVKEPNECLVDKLYADRDSYVLRVAYNKVRERGGNEDWNSAKLTAIEVADKLKRPQALEAMDIYEDTSRYDKYLDKVLHINKYYVTTGFQELDAILGGWDRHNEYATFIGRAGTGKSWILVKSAASAASAGLTVGIYEGEMEADKISYRIDTILSRISNRQLTKGQDGAQLEYKRFLEEMHEKFTGRIKVLTPQMTGGGVGVNKLRAFIERENLDILFVDQHSLLDDDKGASSPIERASNISRDIKQLQVMSGIPIITVSQQNRESTLLEGVSTKNIAMSDRIGQDSTVVIALERKDDTLTLNIIKSRDGGDNSKVKYLIDLDRGDFQYLPNEEDGNPDHETVYDDLRNEYEFKDKEVVQKNNLFTNEDERPF